MASKRKASFGTPSLLKYFKTLEDNEKGPSGAAESASFVDEQSEGQTESGAVSDDELEPLFEGSSDKACDNEQEIIVLVT